MDRDQVLNSLMTLDFMAVDLGLYLNTHPCDTKAIDKYNQIIAAADTVRAKYEQNFGPLCSFRSYAQNGWNWIDSPWPWQKDANFNI